MPMTMTNSLFSTCEMPLYKNNNCNYFIIICLQNVLESTRAVEDELCQTAVTRLVLLSQLINITGQTGTRKYLIINCAGVTSILQKFHFHSIKLH